MKNGTPVCGVTTIIGRFKESGALLQWAFQVGKSGASTLYEKRDQAADIGTIAHSYVESEILGTAPPAIPPEFTDRVMSSVRAWRKWREGSGIEIVATEVPLISEQYRYGGTIDAVGKIAGELCLVDFKTSNAVYADYLLQLAAYRMLWEENNPSQPLTGGFHICRFSKEHSDFEHRWWGNLDEAAEMFRLLVRCYELDREIKKRAK